ncbi:MAG: DNA translocase FtsK [Thermodesulfobacteriota bacterium]
MSRKQKRTPRTARPPVREHKSGIKQEVFGIILLALAVYVGLCLYVKGDANWGGVVGDMLSWGLKTSIGYASYTFPFFLALLSLRFLFRRLFKVSALAPIGFIAFIAVLSAFSRILFSAPGSGGIVGDFLGALLSNYVGFGGAIITLTAAVLISLLAVTGLSLIQVILRGLKGFGAFICILEERFKKRRGERAAAKAIRLKEKAAALKDKKALEIKEAKALAELEKKEAESKKLALEAEAEPNIITGHSHEEAQPQAEPETASADSGKDDEPLEFTVPAGDFILPGIELLESAAESGGSVDRDALIEQSRVLGKKLEDFGIKGKVVEVRPGPVVTMYEYEPAPGVKVNRILSLSNDLALAMKALSIRIIAPIPGKAVVGIEVPNSSKNKICFSELVECDEFAKSRSCLSLAIGKDISGKPFVEDLAKMPHLLIAGATGSGKSVAVNSMISSLLFKATPDDLRFLMIDPKMLELTAYEGIPHLITPVITNARKASAALKSIVAEMTRRYRLMTERGAKNIDMYNHILAEEDTEPGGEHRRLPYIVVVIDELADLMMTSGKDVEESMVRLSQMARASGIHLVVATQRPSVDVVTGLIKTNFPARIAFQLPTRTDSRTILDTSGAETLLGEGDMLFLPPTTSRLKRVHGVYVSEEEINRISAFWKAQAAPAYDEEMIKEYETSADEDEEDLGEEFMRRYDEAVALAATLDMLSTSYLQRRFRIGYNTAARLIEKMEKDGVVGPPQGSKPREVLLKRS